MSLILLTAFFQAAPSAPRHPPQRPIAPLGVESCRVPEYSDYEYAAMTRVVEVPEGRTRFPGSYFFVPSAGAPRAGIIQLHGSGGGRYSPGLMCNARFLASRGYATLAFCYFDCGVDSIPEALGDVDLRRTYEAMVWLKRSPQVRGGPVVLSGASRGAEQAALLASLLGRAATTDSTIVVPDVLYASAPYGRVVGAFNWRANAADQRWSRMPFGPSECWVADRAGRHVGPDGRRRTWRTERCAAEPSRRGNIFDRPAWRWDRDPDRVRPGSEIQLQEYGGPVLVAHGSTDPVWPVADGADHLRRTLSRNGVTSHREVVPRFDTRIQSWPAIPADRVLFYIFEGEPHLFSPAGAVARRELFLAFLQRSLR